MHKIGSLSACIYFINHKDPSQREGYMMLAAYSAMSTPRGWSRHEATTLRECYDLQSRLQSQEAEDWKRESSEDVELLRERFRVTRERMIQRMASSSTTAYDRDFMEAYLQLQEAKLEKHERNFECRNAYIRSLEMDAPRGRRDDEEVANLDRIG